MTYNLLKLMTVLIALPMVTACSWVIDDYDIEEPPVDILSRFGADGTAWLNLEIPLAFHSGSTRATTFDDGDASEYAVHNITLVLLHGSSEANAEVASTYFVNTWSESMDPSAQVTKTFQVTSDNIVGGDNVYLLVILNHVPSLDNMSFDDVKNCLTDISNNYSGTDYYVMSNATLATANNGTGSVKTLVKIDPTLFFETEEEAEQHPATLVYVERLAAKVSVELDDIQTITNGSYTDYYVKGNPNLVFTDQHLADYSIYNYNTQSYLVRHFNNSWLSLHKSGTTDYRFVETQALPYGTPSLYRTYWAEDNNYNTDMSAEQGTAFKVWKTIKATNRAGESDYCGENTMNLAHMSIGNSTLALIRLNLNNYTSFYTTSVTGSDVIYQLPTNPNSEEGTSAHESFTRQENDKAETRSGTSDSHYYVSSARTIDEYLREWLMQTNPAARSWVETYAAGDANHIVINLEAANGRKCGPKDGGQTIVKCTQTASTANSTGATSFASLGLDTYFANNITVNFYDDGYCYYLVPIMHFGDTQTPWESAGTMASGSASAAYGSKDNDYLGRYGVVRNNWYTISITGVTHVGGCNAWQLYSQMADQADDTVEQLLNAKLVINPWNTESSTLNIPTPTPEP